MRTFLIFTALVNVLMGCVTTPPVTCDESERVWGFSSDDRSAVNSRLVQVAIASVGEPTSKQSPVAICPARIVGMETTVEGVRQGIVLVDGAIRVEERRSAKGGSSATDHWQDCFLPSLPQADAERHFANYMLSQRLNGIAATLTKEADDRNAWSALAKDFPERNCSYTCQQRVDILHCVSKDWETNKAIPEKRAILKMPYASMRAGVRLECGLDPGHLPARASSAGPC